MAKPQSIFVNFTGDEETLARAIGEIVGQPLARRDIDVGPVHHGRAFDVEFSLFGDHGLEDDLGIPFSKYSYQLMLTAFDEGLRVSGFKNLYDGMVLFMAEKLSAILRCETMVVENLQREIATFQPGGTRRGPR